MQLNDICIITITLAGTPKEERALRNALQLLPSSSGEIFAADGGSAKEFRAALRGMGLNVVKPARRGLVPQVKAALAAALDRSTREFILYTEPDKIPFFRGELENFVSRSREAHLNFAARDEKSFATFPAGQQKTERFLNEAVDTMAGTKGDFCYGPILLSREAAKTALEAPDHLGWGWRFWLLGKTVKSTRRVRIVPGPFFCPVNQRCENSRRDQIYRLKQLRQNLEGLFLGLEHP